MNQTESMDLDNRFPNQICRKETAMIRLFGLTKIPILLFIGPQVVRFDEDECVIKIPLNWRTKNHLGSMYFAVLAAGADCAGGLMGMKKIKESKRKISLAFKDFHADFFKRATGDTYFINNQGKDVACLVDKTIESGQWEHLPLHIDAFTPSYSADEPVAKFTLTLSLKCYKN